MRFRSRQEIEIQIQNSTVTNGRAHVRCLIRGRESLPDGSAKMEEREEIFELLRDPAGWRVADHLIS